MPRVILTMAGLLFLAGGLSAIPQAPKKEAAMVCKLTGKIIKQCCCEQRQGKLYCTLAKKTIAKCCCAPPQAVKAKRS